MIDIRRYSPPTRSISPYDFTGRETEVALLKTQMIDERSRIVLVTGDYRVGKTSLVMYFADRYKDAFDGNKEFFNLDMLQQRFPQLKKDTELVIFDDLENDHYPDMSSRMLAFIDQHPDRQYLVTTRSSDPVLDRQVNYELKLQPITHDHSLQLLIKELETRLPQSELVKLVNLTQGQPYIIDLLLFHLRALGKPYTLADLQTIIFENIQIAGFRDPAGIIVTPESPIFHQVKSDIQIINANALQWLKMRPENMYKLSPREFEELMAELMEKRGYKVDLTKATRDGGKDLIVARHDDFGNFIYYVECKQYRPENAVGVNLVRELMGTVHADQVTAGILITSSYFSADAIAYSKKVRHQMSLVDFMRLREWLNKI
jgi:HJR/Mrr/RecB family endonuclease